MKENVKLRTGITGLRVGARDGIFEHDNEY
jgi:hypothetical protein